jgi:acyl-CoA reductase-like NAD-dependent aldehyde dehydrogenase
MKLAWEEQFGPVLPIMRIQSVDEAIEHCNASRLALQGCVFTQDVNEALRISDAMMTGTVQVLCLFSKEGSKASCCSLLKRVSCQLPATASSDKLCAHSQSKLAH